MSNEWIKNRITTWRSGEFIDLPQYKDMSVGDKKQACYDESLRVRPSCFGNAICMCNNPEDARWIAHRLNMAAVYEASVAAGEIEDLFGYVLPQRVIERIKKEYIPRREAGK